MSNIGSSPWLSVLLDAVRSEQWEVARKMAEQIYAFDVETHLIQPGLLAPPLVCGSLAWFESGPLDNASGEIKTKKLDRRAAREVFRELLRDPDAILAFANAPFDVLVMATDARSPRCSPGEEPPPVEDLLPEIFAAYEAGRILDCQIIQQLHAIARGHLNRDPRTMRGLVGRYSLKTCVSHVLGRDDAKKNDAYRLRYAELEDVPMSEWPPAARDYLDDDARNTLETIFAQLGLAPKVEYTHDWARTIDGIPECRHCSSRSYRDDCRRVQPHDNLHAVHDQVYTHWCMHLGAAWGFRVDQAKVSDVEAQVRAERAGGEDRFREVGFLRADGSRDTGRINRAVAEAYDAIGLCATCSGTGRSPSPKTGNPINCPACGATGLDMSRAPDVPKTPTDRISRARDVLDESGDELLMAFSEYGRLAKSEEVYLPYLRTGRACVRCGAAGTEKRPHRLGCNSYDYVGVALTLKPNPLLETDRTSYGDVIQQFPRMGKLRSCIAARLGHVLSSTDYNQGELVTLAESCIQLVGESELAAVLNADADPHKALGAQMLGISYADFERWFSGADGPEKQKRAKEARQAAKPPNFGFGGGMGAAKLVYQQRVQGPDTPCPVGPAIIGKDKTGAPIRGYRGLRFCVLVADHERCGVVMLREWKGRPCPPTCGACLEVAEDIRGKWFERWREMKKYFAHVNDVVNRGEEPGLEPGQMIMIDSRIVRGGVQFTNCGNGYFQSLLARAAKRALRRYQRECCDRTFRVPGDEPCGWYAEALPGGKTRLAWSLERPSRYAGGPSPLLGSRVVAFQHDETLTEHPVADGPSDAALRGSEIMVRSLREACPHLARASKAPPAIMSNWLKGADPQWSRGGKEPADDDDRLVEWSA